jgi:hypothetical protein
MATYAPPDLFLIHFWASARYSSASLARLAAMAAIPSSDSWYLLLFAFRAAFPPSDSSYFWKKASESTEREPRSAARSNTNSCTRWPCCHVAGPRSQKQRALTLMAAFLPSDSSYFWKKASESTEREPRSAARSNTNSCTRWPCCHVAGPRSQKQAGLTFRAAFPSSDSSYLWKKASQSTERQPRSAARSNTNSCTRWPCCHVAGPRSQKQRALTLLAAFLPSDSSYFWKKASESTEREPRSAARSNTNSCTRWPCCHVAGPRSQKQRALTLMAAFLPSDSSYFWKKASEPTEREPRSAARSNTNSCTRWPCCHVAGPRSQKQRALTLLVAFPPSDSSYFWKKASEPTEREPGELRAPTQTAARAGRAVTLLARAVKNRQD